MLSVEIPWSTRVWASPFSALAPSERYAAARGQTAQEEDNRVGLAATLAGKALVPRTRDRSGGRQSTYASLKLLFRCRSLSTPVTFITRLRLDAALYERGPAASPRPDGKASP
jgi:hypothetical protein